MAANSLLRTLYALLRRPPNQKPAVCDVFLHTDRWTFSMIRTSFLIDRLMAGAIIDDKAHILFTFCSMHMTLCRDNSKPQILTWLPVCGHYSPLKHYLRVGIPFIRAGTRPLSRLNPVRKKAKSICFCHNPDHLVLVHLC